MTMKGYNMTGQIIWILRINLLGCFITSSQGTLTKSSLPLGSHRVVKLISFYCKCTYDSHLFSEHQKYKGKPLWILWTYLPVGLSHGIIYIYYSEEHNQVILQYHLQIQSKCNII